MENQDIGLGSSLTWKVQESCGSPTLSRTKPYLQTCNYMGAYEGNAWSQLLSPAQFASNSVHAAPPTPTLYQDRYNLIDERLTAHSTVMANFAADIKGDTAAVFQEHNFGAKNAGNAGEFKQVQFLNGLELQPSEACHKRFIIFDQAGSRARIIFHPALVYEFSNSLPNSAKDLDNTNAHNVACKKEVIHEILSAYKESTTAAFPAMAKIPKIGLDSVTLGEGFLGFSTGKETESHMSCNGSSQGYNSQFQEDTEDIEALLSSDDDYDDEEVSTGHTPSEIIINKELSYSQVSEDGSNGVPRKRRRCGDIECTEQEVDFIPTSLAQKAPLNLKFASASVWLRPSSYESSFQPNCRENVVDSEHIDDEFCDSASTNSVSRKAGSKSGTTKKLPNTSKNSRIQKMKRTLDLLRSVIPAGDCTDTADVLDRATRYLKLLQLQVKKMEATQNNNEETK